MEKTHPAIMREGFPFIGGGVVVALIFSLLGWGIVSGVAALFAIFSLWFFRNPWREIPTEEGAVVSPGDGKVLGVETVEDREWIGGEARKISVFLNVIDVHVNRTPIAGKILGVQYRHGKFFNASFDKASHANEANEICVEDDRGRRVVFRQIAGLVARRIVCYLRPGDEVARGEIMGLIRFGSRVEIVVPADARIGVRAGERVKGGSSVVAWLP